MTGLKNVLYKDRAVATEKKKKKLRAFIDSCTLVKVPAFTINDPVFVFIVDAAPISLFSAYARIEWVYRYTSNDVHVNMTCVCAYKSVYVLSHLKRASYLQTCFLCLHIISSYRAR